MFFLWQKSRFFEFHQKKFSVRKLYKRFPVQLYNNRRRHYSGVSFYFKLHLYLVPMKLGTRNYKWGVFSEIYDI